MTVGGAPERHSASPTGSAPHRSVGVREVLLVSIAVVVIVLGAAALTVFLPTDLQRLVFHTPVAIGVLVVGTALVLWRVAVHRPPEV